MGHACGDLMPTLLEIAGASYPKTHEGRELPVLIGKSWRPDAGGKRSRHGRSRTTSPGIFGNRAVRQGVEAPWEYKRLARATGSVSTRG